MRRYAVAAVVFLALRIALLFARQPFFDELFTVWIAAKPFAGILHALMQDSGPPLYYFVVHPLHSVLAMRIVSLACACVSFGLLYKKNAAMLLAVFPPAVLFAVDARSYAMCAMFVTIGVLSLDRDRYDVAAGAFVLAAYSHYYGFFFFPLLIKHWRAFLVALVAFAPGLWLALHQPRAATAWMTHEWPEALFARPPIALIAVLVIVVVVAFTRWSRFATMTVVPIACAVVVAIAGRPVYLPMRFESVIATPLVLAVSDALWGTGALAGARRRGAGAPLGIAFIAGSLLICVLGTIDHANRPLEDYRAAAQFASHLPAPLVASGYLYLETAVIRQDVEAFPAEQKDHPGWRAEPRAGSVPPPAPFYWIGERGAPELSILRRRRRVQPIYANARALVARVM